MVKKIAIVLSGCGVYDGSEIYEVVLTLLSIEKAGAQFKCFAPDITQHHVIDHISGKEINQTRNVLTESARIVRGNIQCLEELSPAEFDGIIIPGGFGVAKNLSDFAFKSSNLTILPKLESIIREFNEHSKPIGLICIAPALSGKVFNGDVRFTIGQDQNTANAIEKTGAQHVTSKVNEIVIDEQAKLVTTPAYMLASSITEAEKGITKLVNKIISMT